MATTQAIQQTTNKTPREICDDNAVKTMSGMRFSSSQGALDYRKMLTDKCMGITEKPTTVATPIPTPTPTPTPTPVKAGVSAIVEPNFANVKVYDLDAPTGSSVPSTSTSTASNEVISEGNGESAYSTLSTTQKPNYLLYGGIAISAIVLYKILK